VTTAYKNTNPPQTPINLSPANAATAQSTAPTLSASVFVDPDAGDIHLASQWIVSKSATGELVLDTARLVRTVIERGRRIAGHDLQLARAQDALEERGR